MKRIISILVMIVMLFSLTACGGREKAGDKQEKPVLKIGAIPDQNASDLARTFNAVAEYLSEKTGLEVEYVPSSDYAALVAAFERGDIHLAWFGGLTGVQARSLVPGSEAIAQRPRDEKFQSVFIAQKGLKVKGLEDLKGLSFTFGSESSTSGHLMPRYFLIENGIDPVKDFSGAPNFSGSHDTTYSLVQSGTFQAGTLNISVWESAVRDGKVDENKVEVFYTTPEYYDYNWTINKLDSSFGQDAKANVKEALLSMGSEQKVILELFQTDKFIETKNENYEAIKSVAKELGIIK